MRVTVESLPFQIWVTLQAVSPPMGHLLMEFLLSPSEVAEVMAELPMFLQPQAVQVMTEPLMHQQPLQTQRPQTRKAVSLLPLDWAVRVELVGVPLQFL